MNSKFGFVLILAGLAVSGCNEPPDLVPVSMPGTELPRVPPPTAGSGAEALGEAGGHNATHHPVSTVISEPTPVGEIKKASSGLTYVTLKTGDGPSVKPGQTIKVLYVGRLSDTTKFDSRTDRNDPFEVVIGVGKVIKGWDVGIPGMKVGEKRQIGIPADMGYGVKGFPPNIPANSNLTFDIEVLDAK